MSRSFMQAVSGIADTVKRVIAHNPGEGAISATYAILAFAAALALPRAAEADDFYWARTDSTEYGWGASGNWASDASGTLVSTVPGASDTIADNQAAQTMHLNFGGTSESIGNWNWNKQNLKHDVLLKNGTLNIAGSRMCLVSGSFTIDNGGVLDIGSGVTWLGGGIEDGNNASNDPFEYIVKSGGQLLFHGKIRSEWMTFTIEAGGYFLFASDAKYGNGNRKKANNYNIYGTVDFPSGVTKFDNSWSVYPTYNLYNGGVMIAGGNFKKGSNWGHVANFMGGELRATADVSFELEENGGVFKSGYDTTLNIVNDGTTLNLGNFSYEDGTPGVICMGAGNVILPGVPYNLEMRNTGTTELLTTKREAMGRLYVGSGHSFTVSTENATLATLAGNLGTITIAAPGLVVGAVGSDADISGTIVVDATKFEGGNTVITTDNTTLRAQVLAAATTAGLSCEVSGDSVVIAAQEDVTFTGSVSRDLSDSANWTGASSAPVSGIVTIAATADYVADSPAFSRIKISPLGNLVIADGVTSPELQIFGGGTITIADGASVTIPDAITVKETESAKPVLIIGEGATLTLDAETYLPDFTIINNGGTIVRTTSSPIVFKWVGGNNYGRYSDLNNWRTSDDAEVSRLPCAQDSFYRNGNFYFDLEGAYGEIGNWLVPSDWDNHYFSASNGVFVINGYVQPHTGTWTITDDATVRFTNSSTFIPGSSSSATLTVKVSNNSLLDFSGTMTMYNGEFEAFNGGSAVFNYSSWRAESSSSQYLNRIEAKSGGFVSFPRGLVWENGGSGNGYTCSLKVTGGELELGGDLTKSSDGKMVFNVEVNGGTIDITAPVTITADSSTLAGNVEFDIASGVTFRLSNFTVDAGTAITKTGAGVLVLDSATRAASIAVNEGMIGFYTANAPIAYPESTTFAAGTGIVLGANGMSIAYAPEQVTFRVDVESVIKDTAIVSSSDAALLERIKTDFETQLAGQSYEVSIVGGAVQLSAISPYTFLGGISTDYSNPANWACGRVPTNEAVVVYGNMTVAGDFPPFASISVERGAAVTVADGITLPNVKLSLTSSLTINADANVTAGLITGVATAETLPVLTVSSGATLTVPAGQKFSNVDLRLASGSKLTVSGVGPVVFGYAPSGETTYFAMTADGATFAMSEETGRGQGGYSFVSPDSGGTVRTIGDITLTGCNFSLATGIGNITSEQGFVFGRNNPVSVPFTVVVSNTVIDCITDSYFSGAATVIFQDGAILRNAYNTAQSNASRIHVNEMAMLQFESGSKMLYPISGNWTGSGLDFRAGENGHVALRVLDGAEIVPYIIWGDQTAVAEFGDATYSIFYSDWWGANRSAYPLRNLKAASVQEGKTLTFNYNNQQMGSNQGNTSPLVTELCAPIIGGGSVLARCDRNSTITLVVSRGDNTATGSIGACDDGKSSIRFSDGANWAGTVIADENMALSAVYYDSNNNGDKPILADGTETYPYAPVTVTFGAVDMKANFTVRVWKDAAGVVTNDMVNITGAGWTANGGAVVVALQDGLAIDDLEEKQMLPLGTIPKTATLPTLKDVRHYDIYTEEIEGDDENLVYGIKRASKRGLVIMLL